MTNQNLPRALFFLGGLLVGVAATSLWLLRDDLGSFGALATSTISTTSEGSFQPTTLVSVSPQSAGGAVVVDSVNVPAPGVWVAVEEINAGELGNVLGAARARAPLSGLTISLLRPTLPAHHYGVVLYRDNGDDVFDLASDSVYVDFDTGARVVAPFTTLP